MLSTIKQKKMGLTVHRNEKGNTIATSSLSDNTKLELPKTNVLPFPKEHEVNPPGSDGCVLWYSFKHNLKAVEHVGQPKEEFYF